MEIATRDVVAAAKTTPIGDALALMASRNVRSILVVRADETLEGIATCMDMVNYLGGGELHDIVVKKHNGSIFAAFKEPLSSIMNPNPITVSVTETTTKALEKMVVNGVGVLPVLRPDGKLYGVITERDLVEKIADEKIDVLVKEVMSKNVVTINEESTIRDACKAMVKFGFRRLPVESGGVVKGIVTAKDIVRYFGKHEAFKHVVKGLIDEVLDRPVMEIAVKDLHTITPDAFVWEAAEKMKATGASSLLVVEDGKLVGIITERDVLYAYAVKR